MNRIKKVLMSFPTPFQFDGMNHSAPAGMYEITTEEEPLGDTMYPVFHRISTSIYIPLPQGRTGIGQIIYVSPEDIAGQHAKISLRV